MTPLARLAAYLSLERSGLYVAIIYSVAVGLLSLVVPIAVQSLVNTVAFGTLMQPLVVLTLIVLACLGLSAMLQAIRTYVVELLQRRVLVRFASEAVDRLLRARMDAFDDHHGPELVNRFLDVVTVQKSGSMLLVDGLSILMQTTIGMLLLAVYHPWLLAFDVLLVVFIAIVLFPMSRGAIPTAIYESKAKYALVAWLEEIARWPAAFKSKDASRYAAGRADRLVREYLSYRSKHFRILLRQIVGSLTLQAIASSLLLGVGGWLVIERQLTLGQLIAAELIVTLVVSGFSKFGKQLETFYDLVAAVDKLGYLTDLELETTGDERLTESSRGMHLNVARASFRYSSGAQILDNASFTVHSGSRVALTGNGKSTLFDILYGLRMPQQGVVELDHHDLRQLELSAVRAQVALVRQPEIFHGSIAENLRLSNPEASTAELREAVREAGLLEDVQALPEGLETELATGGSPLSPRQALRLMIARAILRRPRLLLLDECLDSFDARDPVLQRLFNRAHNWTLVVATKDRAIQGMCDEVYRVNEGSICSI